MYKEIVQYSLFCVSVSATPLLTCLLHVILQVRARARRRLKLQSLSEAPSYLQILYLCLETYFNTDLSKISPQQQRVAKAFPMIPRWELEVRSSVSVTSRTPTPNIQHQRIPLRQCTLSRPKVVHVHSPST
jgi:hypothetical protein